MANPTYTRNVSGAEICPIRIRSWTEVQLSEGWNYTTVRPPPQDVKLHLAAVTAVRPPPQCKVAEMEVCHLLADELWATHSVILKVCLDTATCAKITWDKTLHFLLG